MFQRRENEPDYALLNDPKSQQKNRYGLAIEKAQQGDDLYGKSLNINGDEMVSENPNRYKQHGFFFNADNCIACHACESACSEKNDNPAHLSFRSVGFVEGGTYPAYQRMNISMACNHCDDPVCLKGCPTRAYTKFAEYGAVLQDPDICFGCGYCTWVCPYNAPQLDPVKGQVSKCNMCVDRLEVGLKPACVSACLGKALDFGVIENIPEGREQAKVSIPGFPDPEITHPNIRFEQKSTPPRDMNRVDSTALKYHKDDKEGIFKPELDPKHGYKRAWNWRRLLGSHENAHIAFTLSVQAVMGAFVLLVLGGTVGLSAMVDFKESSAFLPALLLLVALMGVGLFKLNMHLGKPHRFYRGFYNLKHSPVSREIAGVSAFFAGLSGYALFNFFDSPLAVVAQNAAALLALVGVALGGYFMYKLYRIKARPFWDHWQTATTFVGTGLVLGALLLMLVALLRGALSTELAMQLSLSMAAGLALEGVGLLAHGRDLKTARSEGAASFYEQLTTYGHSYWLRNVLLFTGLTASLAMAMFDLVNAWSLMPLTLMVLSSAIIGRALFYVLVIPTTMPGAFFWRNQGFVEHAREVGLAEMPQVGVVYERHHRFKLGALLETIRSTSVKEKLAQLKRVVTG